MVAIWLQTSLRLVVRFASTGILCPSLNLTCMVVTSLFLSGSKMKFSCGLFFLLNLLAGFVGSDNEVPVPENAIYAGGGGGTYFYDVLSDRLTDRPPFGYFSRSFFGISPLLSSFMNSLFSGALQSLKSPSSTTNPFSQRVILQTDPSFYFSDFSNSSGLLNGNIFTVNSFQLFPSTGQCLDFQLPCHYFILRCRSQQSFLFCLLHPFLNSFWNYLFSFLKVFSNSSEQLKKIL